MSIVILSSGNPHSRCDEDVPQIAARSSSLWPTLLLSTRPQLGLSAEEERRERRIGGTAKR